MSFGLGQGSDSFLFEPTLSFFLHSHERFCLYSPPILCTFLARTLLSLFTSHTMHLSPGTNKLCGFFLLGPNMPFPLRSHEHPGTRIHVPSLHHSVGAQQLMRRYLDVITELAITLLRCGREISSTFLVCTPPLHPCVFTSDECTSMYLSTCLVSLCKVTLRRWEDEAGKGL